MYDSAHSPFPDNQSAVQFQGITYIHFLTPKDKVSRLGPESYNFARFINMGGPNNCGGGAPRRRVRRCRHSFSRCEVEDGGTF